MKAHILITDEKGTSFEGSVELVRIAKGAKTPKRKEHHKIDTAPSLYFSLNPRAFMKRYGKNLSGSQKFTLLLARFVEGKVGQEFSVKEIASTWDRMKPVMGGEYNTAHAIRAKEKGWVDSSKRSMYVLSVSWREALAGE